MRPWHCFSRWKRLSSEPFTSSPSSIRCVWAVFFNKIAFLDLLINFGVSTFIASWIRRIVLHFSEMHQSMSSSVAKQSDVLKTGCFDSHYKKRNGKRNSIERKKPNSLSRIPSPTGINTDLSSWPSLWLSSWPRVTKANRRHWRRIGGIVQLLWGWLEFPVSFLTDTVRKVQSCNNSDWGRTNTEQFPCEA